MAMADRVREGRELDAAPLEAIQGLVDGKPSGSRRPVSADRRELQPADPRQ